MSGCKEDDGCDGHKCHECLAYEFTLEPIVDGCVIGVFEMRALFRTYQSPPCAIFVEGYPLQKQGRILTRMVQVKADDPDPYRRSLHDMATATLLERPLEISDAWAEHEAELRADRKEAGADLQRRAILESAI